ncbi:MAG TPA: hypothetical protein VHO70_15110 [Chitinispirillaceae bacterium]|nr:hypothetical protein [Chitinispirillaceae bacterium]
MKKIQTNHSSSSKSGIRTVLHSFNMLLLLFLNLNAKIPIHLTGNLPSTVDNASLPYLRPVFNQLGFSCGSACGIGNVFTYEMNAARSTSAAISKNQYPYLFTYHFLNDGDQSKGTYHMFTDAWDITMESGIPTVDEFGGFEKGFPVRWVSGYETWFSGMKNRVDQYDSVKITGPLSLDTIKQWLFDHGDGSTHGGVAIVTGNAFSLTTDTLSAGPAQGKSIMLGFGAELNSNHAFTIVGYNDSIRYDLNADGQYTNTIDITQDGNVDMHDWEIGALRLVNSWGPLSFGDSGFIYLPYWALVESPDNGGSISNNNIFFCKIKKAVTVKAALKVTIDNAHRNQMAFSVGIANNLQALSPSKIRAFKKQFNYAGGDLPVGGIKDSNVIEIGLDITDLLDSINNASQYRVFFIVDSKSNNGMITALSLMDYSGTAPFEYTSTQSSVPIKMGRTILTVQNAISTDGVQQRDPISPKSLNITYIRKHIRISSPYRGQIQILLRNLQGQTVTSMVSSTSESNIDCSGLARGYYFVTVQSLHTKVFTSTSVIIRD